MLGLDTSTAASAACAMRSDGQTFEVLPQPERLNGAPAHARELMPAIVRCLRDAGIGFGDLGLIAVGVGPGAFTGLRIGVSTARALAHANGTELRPVSSLAALSAASPEQSSLPLIDAKRGEVFAALFDRERTVWPPFAATPDDLAARLAEADVDPLAIGDGSVRFREVLEAAGVRVAPARSGAHVVRGLSICRLAAGAPPAPPDGVLPDYLRLPDAKPR